jgi:hypothetical protein
MVAGAVYTPADVIVPALAVQVTAELNAPVPATVAAQADVPLTLILAGVHTTATEVTFVMATLAVEETAGFCTDVAVIVALPEVGTVAGAVYTPADVIVPALAVHVTAELKVPLPATVAAQLDVPPTLMLAGVQVTATEVTLEIATVAVEETAVF